jgi:hypothetical protein
VFALMVRDMMTEKDHVFAQETTNSKLNLEAHSTVSLALLVQLLTQGMLLNAYAQLAKDTMIDFNHASVLIPARFSQEENHHSHAEPAQLIKPFHSQIQPSVNAQLARLLITELKGVFVRVTT